MELVTPAKLPKAAQKTVLQSQHAAMELATLKRHQKTAPQTAHRPKIAAQENASQTTNKVSPANAMNYALLTATAAWTS
jgi:hypothetical protein